jgi:8-hydroxy-5-deazaflavin:NADPH oxidoreductase
MRIAIIGTGNVGSALGTRWTQRGHEVVFGSRDPSNPKVQKLLAATGAGAASIRDAVADASVVVLATPWDATQSSIAAAGDLSGKILLDATNPLQNMKLALGLTTSGAERVASWARGAAVIKAFNSTGAGNMLTPDYAGQKPTMFICGDDAGAKQVVSGLAEEIGFEAVDAGALTLARYLEPLAGLWIELAYAQGLGPNIAFKLLRR